MHKNVEDLVARCYVCQRHKYLTLAPEGLLQPIVLSEKVWEEVTMNFIEGLPRSKGFSMILIVVLNS